MIQREQISPHPLDGCNEDDCYKTTMSERTVLIAAQREAQDNLIKTIIQLSSALIALMTGFITQAKLVLSSIEMHVVSMAMLCLGCSIISGLMENFFSSRAYKEQQIMLEDYYGRFIAEFTEAQSNTPVRRAQIGAFLFFVSALICLASFGIMQAKGKSDVRLAAVATPASAPSASASAAATSSSSPYVVSSRPVQ